jgi:hypothetical protein
MGSWKNLGDGGRYGKREMGIWINIQRQHEEQETLKAYLSGLLDEMQKRGTDLCTSCMTQNDR